jgi:hypothetical protein
MRRHWQHSWTARTCAIFAYIFLACSECHCLCNHEAPQSNYGACLSAAVDKAYFLYSTVADVKMLQFNSSWLVPNIIRMALPYICKKTKTIWIRWYACHSCAQQPELRWLPHMDTGNPPFRTPCRAPLVLTEDYFSQYPWHIYVEWLQWIVNSP